MEIKKTKIERLRDWWEVASIRLRRSQSKLYFAWFALSLVFYFTLIGLRVTLHDDPVYLSTEMSSVFKFDRKSFRLVERKIDDSNRRLVVSLGNEEWLNDGEAYETTVEMEYKNSSKITTTVHTLTGDNHYTTVYAENLPEKWDVIKMTVTIATDTDKDTQEIFLSREDLESETITPPTKESVLEDSLHFASGLREEAIQTLENDQDNIRENIQANEEKHARLEEQLAQQTDAQRQETQRMMSSLEGANSQSEASLTNIDQQIEEYQQQINKLKERLQEE